MTLITGEMQSAAAPANARSSARTWRRGALVAALTLCAAALRLWKVDWALPYVPHPDEPAIMNVVLRMLRNGDFNPHFFYYPSVWIYVQAAIAWLHLHWGMATGLYVGAAQLPETTDIATSVPGFFAWGRVATALVGAATVPLVYRLAQRLAGSVAGFAAALLLCVNTFHIINSHYITTDVPATFFTALALVVTLRVLDHGTWRDYLLAGALAGLAAGTKHNAALTAAAIAAAHAFRWRGQLLREAPRLVAAAAAMIGAFLVTSPFIVLAWGEFRADLGHQLGDYAAGAHGDVTGSWPVLAYLGFYRERALGLGAGLLALWAMALAALRRDRRAGVLVALVLAYLAIFLPQGNHWMRNLLPTQAPLFALAGVGFADLVARLRGRVGLRTTALAGGALLALVAAPATVATAQYARRLAYDDSRVLALRWIDANVPPGVPIAAELKPVPGAGASRWTEVAYLPAHDLDWYRRQGYAYLVASSDVWQQIAVPDVYHGLAGAGPVAEFPGTSSGLLGPRLQVYATGADERAASSPLPGVVTVGGARLSGVTLGAPDPENPSLGVEPATTFRPGEAVGIRTFWRVEQPFTADYWVFVHLVDGAGNTVAQRDAPPWQGRFPTTSWQPGSLVVDSNDLLLPPNLAPGSYTLVAGMFDPVTGAAPPVTVDGAPQGSNAVPVATVEVVAP